MKTTEKLRVSASMLRRMAQREFDGDGHECLIWSAFQLEKRAGEIEREKKRKAKEA